MREVYSREPKAISIALENLAKISGCEVNAVITVSDKDQFILKAIKDA